MPRRFLYLAIVLTASTLALGHGLASSPMGLWSGQVLAALLCAVWLAGTWRAWAWTPTAGLVLAIGLAAYGLYREAGAGWMLGGVVAALTAWDLDCFVRTINGIDQIANQSQHERQHLLRLLVVDASSLLLGSAALLLRTRLSLALVVALGLLVVLGLNRAIGFLRRASG